MPRNSRRPLILLIDDSPDFRNLLRVVLSLEGYEVVEAADGRDGLRLFDERRPDLVLLDIIMPEQDGIETLREILRRRRDATVFTFSGRAGASDQNEAALLLGARRGFTKPFRVSDLLDAIRPHLADENSAVG
jgi:DNA-binding response OmpR family regulator